MLKNDTSLRELQLVELGILKEFIRVCKELNLRYYIVGGTLLGAVRHKGFIPWDDDIDVAMPRKDYEKFINNAQNIMNKDYFVQNFKTDKEVIFNYTKIRNSNTTFIETTSKDRNINHGVYIDVFPYDNCPNNKIVYKIIRMMDYIYQYKANENYYYKEGYQNVLSSKGKLLYNISNILYKEKSLEYIQNKREKLHSKYKNRNYDKVVSYNGMYGNKEIIPKEYLGNGIEKEFEGIKVNIPEKYDLYLKHFYGDYMKLPPEDKRQPHHYNEKIDLNNSYKKYIK